MALNTIQSIISSLKVFEEEVCLKKNEIITFVLLYIGENRKYLLKTKLESKKRGRRKC